MTPIGVMCPPEAYGVVEPGVYRCSSAIQSANYPFLRALKLRTLLLLSTEAPPRAIRSFVAASASSSNVSNDGSNATPHQLPPLSTSRSQTSHSNQDGKHTRPSKTSRSNQRQSAAQNPGNSSSSNSGGGLELVHLGLQKWQHWEGGWRFVSEELIKEGLEILLDPNRLPALIICGSGVHETDALVGTLRRLQGWSLSSIVFEYRSFAGHSARYATIQFVELFDVDLVSIPPEVPKWFRRQLSNIVEQTINENEKAVLL
ncbi:hypothetical protein GQ42DRAFT_164214 [Ramicandelaber brevisporus]|nr:hypothetical protein GQ42DRAFT_164214 [Ramicandelaber brevisporus]